MNKKTGQFRPRLPREAQTRLKSGGGHKNKKKYDRKRNRKRKFWSAMYEVKYFFKDLID